jgi:lipid-binding SYLF domain-containing protein
MMHTRLRRLLFLFLLFLPFTQALADDFTDTIATFRKSGTSGRFFNDAYGYAVFPFIGKGGFVVAGAHGTGRVYVHDKWVGDTAMTQVSVGAQLGGQAYSQIIFFKDKRAFDEFTSGNFAFGAEATAVAITAAASARASTEGGASAAKSGNTEHADTTGAYTKGMAVFTVVKGGLMYEASIGGQKFDYEPRKK